MFVIRYRYTICMPVAVSVAISLFVETIKENVEQLRYFSSAVETHCNLKSTRCVNNTVLQPRAKEQLPASSTLSSLTLSFLVHAQRSRQMFCSAHLFKNVFHAFVLLTYRELYIFNVCSLMNFKVNILQETIIPIYTISIIYITSAIFFLSSIGYYFAMCDKNI